MKNIVLLPAICAGLAFGTVAVPCILTAQAGGPSEIQMIATPPSSTAGAELATPRSIGPTVEIAGFHKSSTDSRVIMDQEPGPHVGRGLAMTVAGLALLGVAAVVKGGAGTAIAFGGGALALYGVYHWIE